MIRAMLLNAQALLAPQGIVAIVVVWRVGRSWLPRLWTRPRSRSCCTEAVPGGPGAVRHLPLPFHVNGADADVEQRFERGIYDREEITFVLDGMTLTIRTAPRSAPSLTPSATRHRPLSKRSETWVWTARPSLAVFNPGQGHIPAVLWRVLSPQSVALIDRDLLSLRYAAMNLIGNGCGHQPSPSITRSTFCRRRPPRPGRRGLEGGRGAGVHRARPDPRRRRPAAGSAAPHRRGINTHHACSTPGAW